MGIERIINPIRNKIKLLIGRCVISAIENGIYTQRVTVDCLKDEVIPDMERIQDYGLETYPKKSMEGLALFPNGLRDFGLLIKAFSREYRPTDLSEGDVCLYDWNDQRIWLTSNGIKITDKNGNIVEMNSNGIDITDKNANTIEMSSSGVNINGTKLFIPN